MVARVAGKVVRADDYLIIIICTIFCCFDIYFC